jgi:hypothetical protein
VAAFRRAAGRITAVYGWRREFHHSSTATGS